MTGKLVRLGSRVELDAYPIVHVAPGGIKHLEQTRDDSQRLTEVAKRLDFLAQNLAFWASQGLLNREDLDQFVGYAAEAQGCALSMQYRVEEALNAPVSANDAPDPEPAA